MGMGTKKKAKGERGLLKDTRKVDTNNLGIGDSQLRHLPFEAI